MPHLVSKIFTPPQRKLHAAEIALFPADFTDKIDANEILLINRAHNPFAKNKILVRNHKIYWPDYPEDFSKTSIYQKAMLMHELCHVWQYYTKRLSALKYLMRPAGWAYLYAFALEKSFDDYPTEKQADLLQDWYLLNSGKQADNHDRSTAPPTKAQINKTVPFKWA